MSCFDFLTDLFGGSEGQVGIGTMIVFIAMILVSAVAAAALIQTSGYLQQKAVNVGRETTEEVSSGVYVDSVGGHVYNSTLNQFIIYISPSMGGSPIDLNQSTVRLSNGEIQSVLRFNDVKSGGELVGVYDASGGGMNNIFNVSSWSATTDSEFAVVVLQDYDGSFDSSGSVVMNDEDKVGLLVNSTAVFGGVDTRTQVVGKVEPESGSSGIVSFTTPAAYLKETLNLQ